ncbi:MAG: hypothetical protein R3C55_03590 [Parvularculaceae bacterium]
MSAKRDNPDIFACEAPRFYSIEPGRPFLADLAQNLADAAGDDPLSLADVEIFLPTRRAVRALREAFVSVARQGKASLLPRIRPLGDIDEDDSRSTKRRATTPSICRLQFQALNAASSSRVLSPPPIAPSRGRRTGPPRSPPPRNSPRFSIHSTRKKSTFPFCKRWRRRSTPRIGSVR